MDSGIGQDDLPNYFQISLQYLTVKIPHIGIRILLVIIAVVIFPIQRCEKIMSEIIRANIPGQFIAFCIHIHNANGIAIYHIVDGMCVIVIREPQ